MRALVYRGPKDLRLEVVEEPVLRPGDVLFRPEVVGICGSDLHAYAGETGRRVPGTIMGHEACGVVDEVGETVEGLTPGTRVTFNPVIGCGSCRFCRAGRTGLCPSRRVIGVTKETPGAFADQVAIPARNVRPIPANLDGYLGALVEPFAVGVHAVALGPQEPGEVGVLGAGTIGLAAALAARTAGAGRVVVCDLVADRLQVASDLGFETHAALSRDLFELGADMVIDAVGITATLAAGLSALQPAGTLVMVGLGQPQVDMNLFELVTEERRLLGSYCYDEADFDRALAMISNPELGISRLVGGVVALEQGQQAFLDLAEGRDTRIKVMVAPNGLASRPLSAGAEAVTG